MLHSAIAEHPSEDSRVDLLAFDTISLVSNSALFSLHLRDKCVRFWFFDFECGCRLVRIISFYLTYFCTCFRELERVWNKPGRFFFVFDSEDKYCSNKMLLYPCEMSKYLYYIITKLV